MLANTLPLLPFHHTRLAKKEWVNDRQEKKGRVIDLEELRQSFHLDEYLSSEESSSSSEEETESSEYSDCGFPITVNRISEMDGSIILPSIPEEDQLQLLQ